MINDFLVDFYSKKAGEQIDQDKINLINETYGNDYDSLINDLYSKYDPGNINDDKLNLIKQTYNLSIEEPVNPFIENKNTPTQNPMHIVQ